MKEFRKIQIEVDKESRTVKGYAAVFNSESNDLGFFETIEPGAIDADTIARSDVFATFNHDREKILARSKYGQGTLSLDVDERGLSYEFEAPYTSLGNDLIEYLKRGDIDSASFAFTISQDEGAQKWEKRDGKYYRTIYKIDKLFDVSPVWSPAYSEATCDLRSQQEAYDIEMRKLDEEEEKENGTDTNPNDGGNANGDTNNTGDTENQEVEEKSLEETNNQNDNNGDTGSDSDDNDDNGTDTDSQESELEDEERNITTNNKNTTDKKMTEKRFSLIDAINDIANNRSLDSVAAEYNKIGAEQMRSTGLSFGGQLQIPMNELRANVTVASEGEDVVATELYDIIGPLRAKNVLVQAGAKFLTNLVGDIQIPIMSATNVAWAEETGAATDGAPTFSNVTLSPKRLTAYVNISKQLLNQHSVDVDNMIRTDIINAINSKLESTILGAEAGTSTQPAGLFYGATLTPITDITGIAEVEAEVEEANVYGDTKWVISPKFKADLRGMAKGANIAQSLYVNGEIDGTTSLATSNVGEKNAVYGDFSNLAIGQWGAVDLTVDPYTQAKNGMIVLVVNAYFDAKVIRPEAFGFATTAGE